MQQPSSVLHGSLSSPRSRRESQQTIAPGAADQPKCGVDQIAAPCLRYLIQMHRLCRCLHLECAERIVLRILKKLREQLFRSRVNATVLSMRLLLLLPDASCPALLRAFLTVHSMRRQTPVAQLHPVQQQVGIAGQASSAAMPAPEIPSHGCMHRVAYSCALSAFHAAYADQVEAGGLRVMLVSGEKRSLPR